MLDAILMRLYAPYSGRFAAALGGRASFASLAGFVVSLAGAGLIARHFIWTGLSVFALGLVLSALVQRAAPPALDLLFTAVCFASLPFAFALDNPDRAVALIFLSFALTTAMVARVISGPGLIGATELLLLFVFLAIIPGGLVAYLAGILCFVSAGWAARRIG